MLSIRYIGKAYNALKKGGLFLIGMSMAVVLTACGNQTQTSQIEAESAKTGDEGYLLDLDKMIAQNPDVFGWLYIPGTNINYPITQNIDGDDTFYTNHDITGYNLSDKGGIYIESYNLMDMCDFNTVIHGSTTKDGDMFSELWNFADKDYFKNHDQFMIFLQDNTLTYEIWTAYRRDNNNVFSLYDFTDYEGCQKYLDDMKSDWTVNTNFREGWEEGITPDNFIVTLTTVDPEHPESQWVVVGCMISDLAGTIDRDWGEE